MSLNDAISDSDEEVTLPDDFDLSKVFEHATKMKSAQFILFLPDVRNKNFICHIAKRIVKLILNIEESRIHGLTLVINQISSSLRLTTIVAALITCKEKENENISVMFSLMQDWINRNFFSTAWNNFVFFQEIQEKCALRTVNDFNHLKRNKNLVIEDLLDRIRPGLSLLIRPNFVNYIIDESFEERKKVVRKKELIESTV